LKQKKQILQMLGDRTVDLEVEKNQIWRQSCTECHDHLALDANDQGNPSKLQSITRYNDGDYVCSSKKQELKWFSFKNLV
jgi:hypothetical protein